MSRYHQACSECVENHSCLLQDDNSVEECEMVQEEELERLGQDDEDE